MRRCSLHRRIPLTRIVEAGRFRTGLSSTTRTVAENICAIQPAATIKLGIIFRRLKLLALPEFRGSPLLILFAGVISQQRWLLVEFSFFDQRLRRLCQDRKDVLGRKHLRRKYI